MKSTQTLILVVIASVLSLGSSCIGSEEYSLVDDDERRERRRSRMNVRVLDSQGTEQDPLTPLAFEDLLVVDCQTAAASLAGTTCTVPHTGSPDRETSCARAACLSSAALCVANRYLELANSVTPIDVEQYTIPPQSTATRAGFFERAAYHASVAINVGGSALRSSYFDAGYTTADIGGSDPKSCASTDLTSTTLLAVTEPTAGELFIGSLGEGSLLIREAVRGAAARNLAEADTERSRTTDVSVSQEASWHDPVLSRARNAQLVFGQTEAGTQRIDYGLPASCSLEPLTDRGREALRYLRLSGVKPSVVRSTSTDIAAMLEFDDAGMDQSIIERVEAFAGLDATSGTAADFLEAHGLSESDFVEARAHLRCQYDAFARDESQSEQVGGVDVYGATRDTPDTVAGAAYQDVVAVEATRHVVASSTAMPEWDEDEPMHGALHALNYVRQVATGLSSLEVEDSAGVLSASQVDFLGAVAANPDTSGVEGMLTTCANESAGDIQVRVVYEVDDVGTSADYAVVQGAQGLGCAVDGRIDGRACALDSETTRTVNITVANSPNPWESGTAGRVQVDYTASNATSGVEDFLVRRRAGLPGAPPGGFEVIGPVSTSSENDLAGMGAGKQECVEVPAGGELADLLDINLNPGSDNPSSPETTCADIGDGRVPLEAELSDDGDRYETSWRRQISIAAAAAAHADLLGEELIRIGLGVDSRAESMLQSSLRLRLGTPLSGLVGMVTQATISLFSLILHITSQLATHTSRYLQTGLLALMSGHVESRRLQLGSVRRAPVPFSAIRGIARTRMNAVWQHFVRHARRLRSAR